MRNAAACLGCEAPGERRSTSAHNAPCRGDRLHAGEPDPRRPEKRWRRSRGVCGSVTPVRDGTVHNASHPTQRLSRKRTPVALPLRLSERATSEQCRDEALGFRERVLGCAPAAARGATGPHSEDELRGSIGVHNDLPAPTAVRALQHAPAPARVRSGALHGAEQRGRRERHGADARARAARARVRAREERRAAGGVQGA